MAPHVPLARIMLTPPRITNPLYCLSFVDVLVCLASPSHYVLLSLISPCYFSLCFLLTHVALRSTSVHNPSPFLTITCVSPVSFVYVCTELR
ncbi:hypothetical protein BGW80DRAFT_1366235 [Lactifluus volemus]|nr:hypothetical protein BGW80DRAFT_1366235 [Lactifluus volemus]